MKNVFKNGVLVFAVIIINCWSIKLSAQSQKGVVNHISIVNSTTYNIPAPFIQSICDSSSYTKNLDSKVATEIPDVQKFKIIIHILSINISPDLIVNNVTTESSVIKEWRCSGRSIPISCDIIEMAQIKRIALRGEVVKMSYESDSLIDIKNIEANYEYRNSSYTSSGDIRALSGVSYTLVNKNYKTCDYPTNSQMIMFLGDDLKSIIKRSLKSMK